MVTRYTIEQILACNEQRENNSITPVIYKPKGILRGDVEIREVESAPLGEHRHDDNLNICFPNGHPICNRANPTHVHDLEGTESLPNGRSESKEANGTSKTTPGEEIDERASVSPHDGQQSISVGLVPDSHNIVKPVPVRPNIISESLQETIPMDQSLSPTNTPLRPDGIGDMGYSRLDIANSVYGMMWNRYFRGLAASGVIGPLALQGLEHGIPPQLFGGMGLPYHLSGTSRRRGGQVRFTGEQTRRLEAWFHLHKYITPPQRKTIARELNLQERQVKTWFQNRRAKWRKAEGQSSTNGGLPSDMTHSPSSSFEINEDATDEDVGLQLQDDDDDDLVVDDCSFDIKTTTTTNTNSMGTINTV